MQSNVIARNFAAINERIAQACARVGRDPGSVTLIGVSKTVGREVVDAAYAAGLRHFGENRVQDAGRKFEQPLPSDATLHMIGQLQSNKAAQALRIFNVIDSVDRASLIAELGRQAEKADRVVPVLLQVNVAGEEQKAGCKPEDAEALARAIVANGCLRLDGVMVIAPLVDDPEQARPVFAGARELRGHLMASGVAPELPVLSMGMSNDFEVAIEEGATHVRVGRALFAMS